MKIEGDMAANLQNSEDELARRVRELETIAQVSTAVSSVLDLNELLQFALVRTKEQFNLYHVNIALLDESGENLVPVMADNDMLRIHSTSDVPPIPLTQKPSIVAQVARSRRPMLVNDVHTHPDFMPHPLLPEAQAELTIPMIVGEELIGILDVQASEPNWFSETDLRIHTTLASQFAIAVQNARAYQQLRRRAEELTVLNEMSRSFNTAQGIQALLLTFYKHASRLIDTTNFYVAFYEPEQTEQGEIYFPMDVVEGVLLWPETRRPFGRGLTEYIIRTGQPLLIEAHVPEKLAELGIEVPNAQSKSWLGAPMIAGGVVTGVVGLQNYTTPYTFNQESVQLLVSMANQVTLAIENARLFAQVKQQAQNLEIDVAERTAALTQANKRLRTEIDEREQVEEALQIYAAELERSNQELQNFAYVASHDMQEPLRKIMAFGSRLQDKYAHILDARGVDYLRRMQSAAGRMQHLILDLLALSRVTTHPQPFERVALNEIVAQALSDLELRIEQTAATIEIGPLAEIEADPTQTRQLIQNLVSNALKFRRPDVAPVIQIYNQVVVEHGRERCRLMVRDNGIGIEPAHQERIFEIFERLHSHSEIEGTGMGLAICRKIAARHQGFIQVESVPGQGTTFCVTLPVRQVAAGE